MLNKGLIHGSVHLFTEIQANIMNIWNPWTVWAVTLSVRPDHTYHGENLNVSWYVQKVVEHGHFYKESAS